MATAARGTWAVLGGVRSVHRIMRVEDLDFETQAKVACLSTEQIRELGKNKEQYKFFSDKASAEAYAEDLNNASAMRAVRIQRCRAKGAAQREAVYEMYPDKRIIMEAAAFKIRRAKELSRKPSQV